MLNLIYYYEFNCVNFLSILLQKNQQILLENIKNLCIFNYFYYFIIFIYFFILFIILLFLLFYYFFIFLYLYFLISQETNGALGTLSISVSPGFLDYHDSNLKELSKDLHVFKVCAFALELWQTPIRSFICWMPLFS